MASPPSQPTSNKYDTTFVPIQRPWAFKTTPLINEHTGLGPMDRWESQTIADEPWHNTGSVEQAHNYTASARARPTDERTTSSRKGQAGS
ncbi:hypothetical protein SCARD494_11794 [Seiridium cardinale]